MAPALFLLMEIALRDLLAVGGLLTVGHPCSSKNFSNSAMGMGLE